MERVLGLIRRIRARGGGESVRTSVTVASSCLYMDQVAAALEVVDDMLRRGATREDIWRREEDCR